MLRDALLRSAPRHEAGTFLRLRPEKMGPRFRRDDDRECCVAECFWSPCQTAKHHRPYCFAAPGTPSSRSAPGQTPRGVERQAAHQSSVLPRSLIENAGASRRSTAAISDPGSAFPGFRCVFFPALAPVRLIGLSRAGRSENFAAVPVQQAPCGGVVVPPDRFPGPPECEATSLARGRRTNRCAVARRRSFGVMRRISGALPHRGSIIGTSRDDALSRARRSGGWKDNMAEVWNLFL
jgi:hypothetical protein